MTAKTDFAPFFYALLALAFCFAVLPFSYFIGNDGVYYARMAENIWAGNGIVANVGQPYTTHPPFFPFLIGFLNLFLRNLELSAHIISILAFGAGAVLMFHLAERLYSRRTAHFAAFLYATQGFLVLHSAAVLADSLFVVELLFCCWLVFKLISREGPPELWSGLFGAASGLAFLTRPEGYLLYPAGLIPVFLFGQKKLRALLFSLPVFLVLFLPYVFFVREGTGRWDFSTGIPKILVEREYYLHPAGYFEGKKIYDGLTEDKTRLKRRELMENFDTVDYLTKDGFKIVRTGLASLIWRFQELNKYLYMGFGLFFIGAGLLARPWPEKRKKSEVVLFIFLLTFLPKVLSVFHPRYFFHYIPILLFWMGHGFEIFREWGEKTFRLPAPKVRMFMIVLCLGFGLFSAAYAVHVIRSAPLPYHYRELGKWMKRNLSGVEKAGVAGHASVAYYSGGRILFLPYVEKIEDLFVYLRHQGGKYFVVSEDLHPLYLETYGPLLDPTKAAPDGTRRLHIIEGRKKAVLYELVSAGEGGLGSDPYFVS